MQLTIVPAETGWGESGCSTGNNAQYLEKKRRKEERVHYEQHDIQNFLLVIIQIKCNF